MDLEHKQKTDLCYFHSRDSLMHMALMVGSLYREYEKNEVESTVPIKSIPPPFIAFINGIMVNITRFLWQEFILKTFDKVKTDV